MSRSRCSARTRDRRSHSSNSVLRDDCKLLVIIIFVFLTYFSVDVAQYEKKKGTNISIKFWLTFCHFEQENGRRFLPSSLFFLVLKMFEMRQALNFL